MNAIAIVPVRLAATRFPGKPMKPLCGLPMVAHCYHRARLAPGLSGVYVATCDVEIAEYARGIGAPVVMTAATHRRATTRTAEAVERIETATGRQVDAVVMVQGDEPLVEPETIAGTVDPLGAPSVEIVNVIARLRTREAFVDRNNVKVVFDRNMDALYYSREPIPSPWLGLDGVEPFMQTGIIAFRRDALLRFTRMAETMLERTESVDMNRVLESGGRIRLLPTDAVCIGVDTPEDLLAAEARLATDPTFARYRAC